MSSPQDQVKAHPGAGQLVAGTVAFVVGVVVAVQGRINGELGDVTGNGILAAAINFTVGLLFLLVLVLPRDATRNALRGIPALIRGGALPWWALLGGLGGAIYVTGQTVTVSVLGVALFTVATVAGSTGMGLVVDKVGLGPGGKRAITGLRVVASVLAVLAVWVGSSGRHDEGSVSLPFLLLALAAGGASALQIGVNGRVSAATKQPLVAALVNFSVGLIILLVVLVGQAISGEEVGSLTQLQDKWWLMVGGFLGVLFVAGSAWSVRALGVLVLSLVVLAGTLVGAVLVDLLVPTSGATVNAYLLAAIAMTFASVGLAVMRRRTPTS